MLRPRAIYLKNPIEMHYVRNGPRSQLWLFQFHECYFFIKVKGGQNIALAQKRQKTKQKGDGAAPISKPNY